MPADVTPDHERTLWELIARHDRAAREIEREARVLAVLSVADDYRRGLISWNMLAAAYAAIASAPTRDGTVPVIAAPGHVVRQLTLAVIGLLTAGGAGEATPWSPATRRVAFDVIARNTRLDGEQMLPALADCMRVTIDDTRLAEQVVAELVALDAIVNARSGRPLGILVLAPGRRCASQTLLRVYNRIRAHGLADSVVRMNRESIWLAVAGTAHPLTIQMLVPLSEELRGFSGDVLYVLHNPLQEPVIRRLVVPLIESGRAIVWVSHAVEPGRAARCLTDAVVAMPPPSTQRPLFRELETRDLVLMEE